MFASLSDQLYGTPEKHIEIRGNIIDHMRTFRPLFEHYVHLDDVQQRRALRSTTAAARKGDFEDVFKEYLVLMSKNGTYGGEPELVAFCQYYDQDVTVHLPRIQNFDRDSILYKNEHRGSIAELPSLHICYGGDEVTRAHYDSARCRDGSQPRHLERPLSDTRRTSQPNIYSTSPHNATSNRSLRNSRSDLSAEMIHDFIRRGKREVEGSLEQLNDRDRARSPSVTSSHRSSSSKRSLDDDGDGARSSKRADRRKSLRRRLDMVNAVDTDRELVYRFHIESPSPRTPASTQDTEYSSEAADHSTGSADEEQSNEKSQDDLNDSETGPSPSSPSSTATRKSTRTVVPRASSTASVRLMSVTERPRSTLRA